MTVCVKIMQPRAVKINVRLHSLSERMLDWAILPFGAVVTYQ